jgi:hypothetical protein
MNAGREPIRSYQRIFRPERRIYQLEGRVLPVPGGVPLRWLGYGTGALVAVLALGTGSMTIALFAALVASLGGLAAGGRNGAALAGGAAFAAFWAGAFALGLLDWPLRLVVVPVGFATMATQATPDGRKADRFAASWLALRLAPRRRSLGRGLPAAGVARREKSSVWVAPDEHCGQLRRGRVRGAATVAFASEIGVRRAGLRQRRLLARPPCGNRRRNELVTERLALGKGELLEVRP